VTDDNFELYKAHHLLAETKQWDQWSYCASKPVSVEGLGTVEIAHTLEDTRTKRSNYYDSAYEQGSTAPAGMIFRVTYPDESVRHFQKSGTFDSYGEAEYTGSFFEVATVEKTILTFEPTTVRKFA
jgi:hypothetical protein